MSESPWDDPKRLARLRVLWDKGEPCAAIGRELGVSKNSVIAKVHRLHLPARASPIVGGNPDSLRQRLKQRVAERNEYGRKGVPKPQRSTLPAVASAAVAVAAQPAPRPEVRPVRAAATCCWPVGERGQRGWRFCEGVTVPGKPYCAEHVGRAYLRAAP